MFTNITGGWWLGGWIGGMEKVGANLPKVKLKLRLSLAEKWLVANETLRPVCWKN